MSSSCCEPIQQLPKAGDLTIALAGNPNSGKTTIFNALTGLRQKVANYPGVTVEKKTGRSKLPGGKWATVIDLPGTYSLISRSPDEHVAMEVLRGLRAGTPPPDVVIVVVDASNLQRNLYLVSQLIEMGRPMVVALNMMDIAERRGMRVSAARLSDRLGVPVVPIVGHKKRGIENLKQAVFEAKIATLPAWDLPREMGEELISLAGGLQVLEAAASGTRSGYSHAAMSERLLIGDHAADIAHLAVMEPVASLLSKSTSRLKQLGIDPVQADIEAHYTWIEHVAAAAMEPACAVLFEGAPHNEKLDYQSVEHRLDYASKIASLTESVDRVLLHKVWGLAVFVAIMTALFVSIFLIADPIMGGMESAVGWVGEWIGTRLLPETGALRDLWFDGIVAGVGGVVVFVPQIAILFLFLAILEDSGYLARAAFLMDRLLSKVGLHGKSFIPMLSSFACAIPGIMACRTIENRKDRLATIFVAPFMSCSARLPVYALLIGAFFGSYSDWVQGGIMLSLYLLGILAAVVTAWVFKRSLLKGAPTSFILELPAYKVPQLGQIVRTVWTNTKAFLVKAGTTIFALSVILWAMTYYPRLSESQVGAIEAKVATDYVEGRPHDRPNEYDTMDPVEEGEAKEQAVSSEQLRQSIAGKFGHFIEPAIRPLGYDWKMGVGLVGAFAAREVFVSTMGIVYSAGDTEESTTSLEGQMKEDKHPDGRLVWTPLVAVSLLIWFVLAMQCMSTLAIVRRETGGWKWPIGMLVYMNGLAWVICFAVYQVGRIWFV